MSLRACLNLALILSVVAPAQAADRAALPADPAGVEFFESRIRPLLVENCYRCHSASAEKIKGEFLLDTPQGLLKGGKSGQAPIVPGEPEKSPLIEAVRWGNEDFQMPPKKKLGDAQIADLVAWVKMGAPDPRIVLGAKLSAESAPHWAFQKPRMPAIPAVHDQTWCKTPIDAFVLARLDSAGLKPSPPADRRTLLRRLSHDLTGLPPTPEEMDSFVADPSPNAYERAADRLLASARYGERWGRHWLDLARYSDTKGYVYDREERFFVHAWAYRDWVIRAMNEDLPYDQFLTLQIAADQCSAPSAGGAASAAPSADLAAMGFLTGGRRFLNIVHDIIDDRIDVVTRTTQGLTVACARCHDHKFDPIPTQDYYSLYGVFAGSRERLVSLGEPAPQAKDRDAYLAELKKRTDKSNAEFAKRIEAINARLRSHTPRYLMAVLDAGKLNRELFYETIGPNDLNPAIISQWNTYLLNLRSRRDQIFAVWTALAQLKAQEFEAAAPGVLARVLQDPSINDTVAQAFRSSTIHSMRDVATIYAGLFEHDLNVKGQPGSPLIAMLTAPDSPARVPSGSVAELEYFLDESARVDLGKLQGEIDRLNISSPAAPPHALILEDREAQPNPRVFKRGNPVTRGEEVPRRYLSIIAGAARQPFTHGSGRLEMARAIASRDNPLTARVMVNRIWAWHFGQGLVATPSDFGRRCQPPSHPELLDYLAVRFVEEGWSLKKLHRLIVLSSTYQQSSGVPNSSAASVDPENRLLWHFTRQRMDFESLRDAMLLAGGDLDLSMGGRPVDLFAAPFPARRSVYGLVDRQYLPNVLRAFDFANPDLHTPMRHSTTIPQQALFLMNHPLVIERARHLAAREEIASASDPAERIRRLYRLLYQRPATPAQIEMGLRFIQSVAAEPTPPPPPPLPPSVWSYGYGEFDPVARKVKSFTLLPHFTGDAWQGGPTWPDPALGWVRLTADGGHAGNDLTHAAILRFTAPRDVTLALTGLLGHAFKEGDGIRARVISSRHGELASWTLHNQKTQTTIDPIDLKKGDTLDFYVDLRDGLNNDQFTWAPMLASVDDAKVRWNAKQEFAGTPPAPQRPLSPWERYAQVLLLSNEFVFVD